MIYLIFIYKYIYEPTYILLQMLLHVHVWCRILLFNVPHNSHIFAQTRTLHQFEYMFVISGLWTGGKKSRIIIDALILKSENIKLNYFSICNQIGGIEWTIFALHLFLITFAPGTASASTLDRDYPWKLWCICSVDREQRGIVQSLHNPQIQLNRRVGSTDYM